MISESKYGWILFFFGLTYFLGIGQFPLFDWDEINFAETSREMIVLGDYFTTRINYEAFHEKPPLFNWLQVISMKVFGINEFAARFPNALFGLITLFTLFLIGRREKNKEICLELTLLHIFPSTFLF